MIIQAKIGSLKDEVLAYIVEQKKLKSDFSVVDIGAIASNWAESVHPLIMDIQQGADIVGDICLPEPWEKLVAIRPQHDFCICTHTLEDIRNPEFALRMMVRIFKEGYIEVPNKHTEMWSHEQPNFVGYCHHRWVWTVADEKLKFLAKFPITSNFALHSYPGPNYLPWVDYNLVKNGSLCVWWKDGLTYEIINDDFPGYNCLEVMELYKYQLAEGL